MNEIKLNSIYQKIAQTNNENIPEEWSKVLMYGEIADGTGTAFFFYYTNNSEVPIYSHDIRLNEEEYDKLWYQLLDELKVLSDEFKVNNQEQWTN
ncbi:immunity protein YezG family protein [Peribacillus frigoritolerans]